MDRSHKGQRWIRLKWKKILIRGASASFGTSQHIVHTLSFLCSNVTIGQVLNGINQPGELPDGARCALTAHLRSMVICLRLIAWSLLCIVLCRSSGLSLADSRRDSYCLGWGSGVRAGKDVKSSRDLATSSSFNVGEPRVGEWLCSSGTFMVGALFGTEENGFVL